METMTHPKEVKIGDKLTLSYHGDDIEVTVVDEPYEIEAVEGNDGWWQCPVSWKPYLSDWFAVWNEENKTWELGE